MRGKEDAHDYRYFPDPDLLPLVIDDDWIDAIKNTLPELPYDKKERFINEYRLSFDDASFLTSSRELSHYFEACVNLFPNPKAVSNWIIGPLMGLLNAKNQSITESPISPGDLAELLDLMDKKVISGKIAKTVFDEMAQTGKPPKTIVKEKGWVQVTDETAIKQVVVKVLESYPKEVNDYKNGKTKLLGFFVGQVMKKTQGKANPKMVNDIFKKILNDGRVTSNE